MKRADEAVEKVLAELRGLEVDSGFEERMVRRVRGAARERGASGWFGFWQWVGAGCVAMLLIGSGVRWRGREMGDVVATNVRVGRVQAGLDGVGAVEKEVSQRLKPNRVARGFGTTKVVPLSKAGFSGQSNESRDVGSSKVAGFPAPSLPLTAQERMLLRAARGGEAVPAAVLEISVLPTPEAEETAELLSFSSRIGRLNRANQERANENGKDAGSECFCGHCLNVWVSGEERVGTGGDNREEG